MIRTAAQLYGAREPHRVQERQVRCAVETRLPTPFGEFRLRAYENEIDNLTHLALLMGEPEDKEEVLVRVHSACQTGDALHSLRCDCGQQLRRRWSASPQRAKGSSSTCSRRAGASGY